MGYLDKIEKTELRELLNKNWMTHDAMWFSHSVQNIGIEKTNVINRTAVKSMAMIEVKRITKAFNIDEIKSFEEFKKFLLGAFEVVKGEFMDFKVSFPKKNVLIQEISNCFAYMGVKRLGVIDKYECGIFDRPEGWFDSLGIEYEASPQFQGCLMHQNGKCVRKYKFNFSD